MKYIIAILVANAIIADFSGTVSRAMVSANKDAGFVNETVKV